MSVSHCMHQALEIGATPRDSWAGKIAALPDSCSRSDCGAPHSCRERIAAYLRVQWFVQLRAERKAGARA
jgi:hypothetical protein